MATVVYERVAEMMEEKNVVQALDSSPPSISYNPETQMMEEVVPEPYWKSAKQYAPQEITQFDLRTFFVHSSKDRTDGYLVTRTFSRSKKVFRWVCNCPDFTERRQGSTFPYCKHIYAVYIAFVKNSTKPEYFWLRMPYVPEVVEHIFKAGDELEALFREDYPAVFTYYVQVVGIAPAE